MKSMEVKATLKENETDLVNPGDFCFTQVGEGRLHLGFMCPCGCGDFTGIIVREDGQHSKPAWGWNKDREKPTVTPSIRRLDRCQWHGHLTDGVFKSC
jgi:hypothetical protein